LKKRQVRQWLAEVANQRLHRETRERPLERFKSEALRPLPIIPHDYRDSTEALVHKDLRLAFDGNRYCVHQRYVGRRLTVKADSGSVVIYDRVEEVVSYPRSWRCGQTFGADRFFESNNWYLASATDALYNAGGTLVVRNTAGTAGTHLGQEVDEYTTWTISKPLLVGAGIAHILPGEFLKNVTKGNPYTYPYMMFVWKF
jgi:hypothetical protein